MPVAQRIRALVFGTRCRRFESYRAYHIKKKAIYGLIFNSCIPSRFESDCEAIGSLDTQRVAQWRGLFILSGIPFMKESPRGSFFDVLMPLVDLN